MKVVMEKIAQLFPAYLMNPANHENFHPQNFCRLRYASLLTKHVAKISTELLDVVDVLMESLYY